jgi:hypothetical protein
MKNNTPITKTVHTPESESMASFMILRFREISVIMG